MRTRKSDGLASTNWQRLDLMEAGCEKAYAAVGKATWNIYSREKRTDLNGAQRRLAAILTDESFRRFMKNCLAHCNPQENPVLPVRRSLVYQSLQKG